MAAAMVSEGDSGSRSWSRVLRGIPRSSGTPCLPRAISGTPSSGLRGVPDWACLPESSPSPALAPHSGLSRPGVLREALGRRKGLGYRLCWFLFLLWSPLSVTPIFQFPLPSPGPSEEPPIIPAFAPPSYVQILLVSASPLSGPVRGSDLTSDQPPRLKPVSEPVLSPVRTSALACSSAHPSRLWLPRTRPFPSPSPTPRPFPNYFSCLLSVNSAFPGELLSRCSRGGG